MLVPNAGTEQDLTAGLGGLEKRGWLAEQPLEFQAWAARSGSWVLFEPRQMIFAAGDPPDALYGLATGALQVTFPLIGDEPVVLYRAEPGFWVGDSAVAPGTRRAVSIEAATRSRVFRIPSEAMRDLVAQHPAHWQSFYRLSHMSLMTAVTLLAEALALSPKARVARTLQRLMDADGCARISQLELARMIGMTRSTMQRSIAELIEAGAIETAYRALILRDAEALMRAAQDQ